MSAQTEGLEVKGLTVRFASRKDLPVLDDLDLSVAKGETVAVLGPSGSGKSTLLCAIAGLIRIDKGSVCFAGKELTGVPTHRRGISMVFQDAQLFPHLNVSKNVSFGLEVSGATRSQIRDRVDELLEMTHVAHLAQRPVAGLSGGEKQRVALARALAIRPRLILLDEPLSALDAHLRETLAAEIKDILQRTQTTAILVTHDNKEASYLAARSLTMTNGRLTATVR